MRTWMKHIGPSHNQVCRRILSAGLLFVIVSALDEAPCQAQIMRSRRPSESGPTNQLMQQFGLHGGFLGPGSLSLRDYTFGATRGATSTAQNNIDRSRALRAARYSRRAGSGQAGFDMYGTLGQSDYGSGGPLVMGQPSSLYSGVTINSRAGAKGAVPSLYNQTLRAQRQTFSRVSIHSDLVSPEYLTALPPEALVVPAATSRPADASTQTFAELVRSQMSESRRHHLTRAKQAFWSGRYSEALRALSLAETASLDERDERVRIKVLTIYFAIAAGEYNQAAAALEWLLGSDVSGNPRDISAALACLNGIDAQTTVGRLYGNAQQYAAANANLEATVLAARQSPSFVAVQAMAEWGNGSRDSAVSKAAEINRNKTATPAQLGSLTRLEEVLRQVASTPADAGWLEPSPPPASQPASAPGSEVMR
jgi:hypothetical protein